MLVVTYISILEHHPLKFSLLNFGLIWKDQTRPWDSVLSRFEFIGVSCLNVSDAVFLLQRLQILVFILSICARLDFWKVSKCETENKSFSGLVTLLATRSYTVPVSAWQLNRENCKSDFLPIFTTHLKVLHSMTTLLSCHKDTLSKEHSSVKIISESFYVIQFLHPSNLVLVNRQLPLFFWATMCCSSATSVAIFNLNWNSGPGFFCMVLLLSVAAAVLDSSVHLTSIYVS